MHCAGILLTGGASRRMGRDKAGIAVTSLDGGGTQTLAERSAAVLSEVAAPAVEVGPGYSSLASLVEEPPGQGPLAAVAAGWQALTLSGWTGPVLVVATDLPRLTPAVLRWLADHPARASVVPVSEGRLQPLCARYSSADAARAVELVAAGARSMRELLDETSHHVALPGEWTLAAGDRRVLADADTPHELDEAVGTS